MQSKKDGFAIRTIVISCIFLFITLSMATAKNKQIQLPVPVIKGRVSLEEAISLRRSQRKFTAQDLELSQIGQLLWAGQGITAKRAGRAWRAAPSAGALYPMEVYVASAGYLAHYLPDSHSLEIIEERDTRQDLCAAALGQGSVSQAAVDIIICAVYSRLSVKYGQRSQRYAHIEAGHIAQNIHLEAVALGLGSVPVGAFDDAAVARVCRLPEGCEPLYIIPVGYSDI